MVVCLELNHSNRIKNRVRELALGCLCEWGAIQNQVVLFRAERLCVSARNNKGPLRPPHVSECCLELVRNVPEGIRAALTARTIACEVGEGRLVE